MLTNINLLSFKKELNYNQSHIKDIRNNMSIEIKQKKLIYNYFKFFSPNLLEEKENKEIEMKKKKKKIEKKKKKEEKKKKEVEDKKKKEEEYKLLNVDFTQWK
jgi:hypothetical protein